MKEIINLNGIKDGNVRGLRKRWLYSSSSSFHIMCDYLQKIGYSIQDLNNEIECLNEPEMKDLIYIISLCCWINDSVKFIKNGINSKVLKGFCFSRFDELQKVKQFLSSIRSFVVAHPLETNQHSNYGFDGNYICVDIRHDCPLSMNFEKFDKDYYKLDLDGLHHSKVMCDGYLYCYSKKEGNKYFVYIGFNYSDLYHIAEVLVEELYELDYFLSKKKKKEYLEK